MPPRTIIGLIALALGLPFLVLIALTASNPGIHSGFLGSILGGSILMTFVVLLIFEIKRLADESSDTH